MMEFTHDIRSEYIFDQNWKYSYIEKENSRHEVYFSCDFW